MEIGLGHESNGDLTPSQMQALLLSQEGTTVPVPQKHRRHSLQV